MTIPLESGSAAGPLAVHANFYEFIPEDSIDDLDPPILLAHELEQGQRYYVILTGGNGLYRYDINDIVEVRGFHNRTPKVAFVRKGRDMVNIVGRPTVASWVQFNAESGRYDVVVDRDERSVTNPMPRKNFRFELQGPNAWRLLEKLNGGPIEDIKFFNMGAITVAGRRLRALRHGMGGAPGLEFWGPLEYGPEVKAAILAAGEEFGLRQVGGRAYSSAAVDSGWIPCPLPGIYTGEHMRPYREWLKADSFDAVASLGGSFYSKRIEDYYFTPWDLDYGRLIKFDHDFIGRAALEEKAKGPHRKKVSLVWNADDVAAIHRSLGDDNNGKYMEMPTAHYASYPYDRVVRNGRTVGVSTYLGHLFVDRAWVSLAVVDEAEAELGRELTVVWGEEDGGSNRPLVERHVQMEARATVAAWPFSKLARQGYRHTQS